MKAYKGFNRHEDGTLWCRGFQYEVGKTYKFDGEPILCGQGFHACREPHQCWVFYPNNGENVYYEVECGGKIVESDDGDGKFVCTEIKLIKGIPVPENKFDACYDFCFCDGRAIVKLNSKYNYINTNGRLLSEQWFDYCWNFQDGYAKVELNDKWNLINTDGKLISEQWWDYCWHFQDGYGKVELNGKFNHINTDGKAISDQWWDWCGSFCDGYAMMKLDGKYNYINTDGKLISEQWWEDGFDFHDDHADVKLNDKWHKIDKTGKIIENGAVASNGK